MMQTSSIDDDMCVEETIIIVPGTSSEENEKYSLKRIITEEER